MSAVVHYSFYLESEAGVPADNLSPEFVFIKNIPDGAYVSFSGISISNLGDGLYGFTLDWSLYDTPRPDSSRNSLFIKIDTKLQTLDQKFLTMRVERQDYLPELVDSIQASSDSLNVSASLINEKADSLLMIEEGHWIIDNNFLMIFTKNTAKEDRVIENAEYVFELRDNNGELTSQEIYQRINANPDS